MNDLYDDLLFPEGNTLKLNALEQKDVFVSREISTRSVRGGKANAKQWGPISTFLIWRTIHIQVLKTMEANSFICALRRFFTIRGPVTKLRSARGSIFVGGKSQLDGPETSSVVAEQVCEWIFNLPYTSQFGGVWNRRSVLFGAYWMECY